MSLTCPQCQSIHQTVLATRRGNGVNRRRRRCQVCNLIFWTEERLSTNELHVRKADGAVVPFSTGSVRRNITEAAVTKLDPKLLATIVDGVVAASYKGAEDGIIPTSKVAQAVMAQLRDQQPETHIRFALSYKSRRGEAPGWSTATDIRRWLQATYPALARRRADDHLREVVKRDGTRTDFDRDKLEKSIQIAAKGYGDHGALETFAVEVADEVRHELYGQPLVTSGQIAAEVLRVLRRCDAVAYLRYASSAKGFTSERDYDDEAAGLERDDARPEDDGGRP